MAADVDRMMDMITKILDASRLDQRRIALKPEPVALLPAIGRALDELEHRPYRSSARVEVEVGEDLEVLADRIGVGTVLRNLLDNALRSVAAGGGGEVRIRAQPSDRFVQLTVADGGGGFDPEEASRLFDKFYRPGDELRRKGGGQGLGLYIVHKLLELERGRVRAHSDGIGKGATFEVWWPAAKRGEA